VYENPPQDATDPDSMLNATRKEKKKNDANDPDIYPGNPQIRENISQTSKLTPKPCKIANGGAKKTAREGKKYNTKQNMTREWNKPYVKKRIKSDDVQV
jgi:hypothetical protein